MFGPNNLEKPEGFLLPFLKIFVEFLLFLSFDRLMVGIVSGELIIVFLPSAVARLVHKSLLN